MYRLIEKAIFMYENSSNQEGLQGKDALKRFNVRPKLDPRRDQYDAQLNAEQEMHLAYE